MAWATVYHNEFVSLNFDSTFSALLIPNLVGKRRRKKNWSNNLIRFPLFIGCYIFVELNYIFLFFGNKTTINTSLILCRIRTEFLYSNANELWNVMRKYLSYPTKLSHGNQIISQGGMSECLCSKNFSFRFEQGGIGLDFKNKHAVVLWSDLMIFRWIFRDVVKICVNKFLFVGCRNDTRIEKSKRKSH